MKTASAFIFSLVILGLVPALAQENETVWPSVVGFSNVQDANIEVPVNWVAGVEIVWQDVEPERGQYQFKATDERMRALFAKGLTPIPILVPESSWAGGVLPEKSAPGNRPMVPPADLEAWSGFVGRIVERYDGDGSRDAIGTKPGVDAWQTLPALLGGWSATLGESVDYLASTAAAIRAADAEAVVVLGALRDTTIDLMAVRTDLLGGVRIGENFLTKGGMRSNPSLVEEVELIETLLAEGADSYDVIDIHHFGSSDAIADRLNFLRGFLVKHGVRGKRVWSLFNTLPTIFGGMPDTEAAASEMLRGTLEALLGGCHRFAWPAERVALPPPTTLDPYPLLDAKGQPGTVFQVFDELSARLEGLESLVVWKSPGDAPNSRVIWVETSSTSPFAVIWNQDPREIEATFPARGSVNVQHAITGDVKKVTPVDGRAVIPIGPYPVFVQGIGEPKDW